LSLFSCYLSPLALHSFPTRRSSDLCTVGCCTWLIKQLVGNGLALHRQAHWVSQVTLHCLNGLCNVSNTSRCFDQQRHIFGMDDRSEEHTSELQSLAYLVCRLLLEKK